jgi:hypothetical protein
LLDMPAPEPPALEAKDYRERYEELIGPSLRECPVCHQGRMKSYSAFRSVSAMVGLECSKKSGVERSE